MTLIGFFESRIVTTVCKRLDILIRRQAEVINNDPSVNFFLRLGERNTAQP